jgi:hypothetical protein
MNDDDANMSTSRYAYVDDTITINVGDLSTVDLGSIDIAIPFNSVWDDDLFETKKRTSVVHDLDNDPLASIIQLKRDGVFPDIELIQKCVPEREYVVLAQSIREYYLDKIITQKLSSRYRESEFKKDMVKALKLSGKCVLEDSHIKLLYRLDDFYTEDTFVDNLVSEYTPLPNPRGEIALDGTPLEYVGRINVFRRGSRITQFYFKTSNNYLIRLKGPMNDWLMPLTAMFKHVKQLKVSGKAGPRNINRDHDFNIGELNIKYNIDDFII